MCEKNVDGDGEKRDRDKDRRREQRRRGRPDTAIYKTPFVRTQKLSGHKFLQEKAGYTATPVACG